MTQVNVSEYKGIYLQTAREYLDNIEASLSKLSINSLDSDALNNLHISSHSLRSQSQVMEYNDIADLSGNIEEISSSALENNSRLNDQVIAGIKKSIKELNEMLKSVQHDTGNKI